MFTADTEQVGIFGEKSKTSAAISIGEKNSYKGQLFHSIEGKESVTYFQMNVFNYGLDKDSFSGQEIGFGYRSGGFFAAMAGLSQFQTELYAGLGQLQLGKAAGYYIDFGATLIGNQSKLMLTGSAELNKNAHWSLGLKYSYSFGP